MQARTSVHIVTVLLSRHGVCFRFEMELRNIQSESSLLDSQGFFILRKK